MIIVDGLKLHTCSSTGIVETHQNKHCYRCRLGGKVNSDCSASVAKVVCSALNQCPGRTGI
jgi:hypothetical protein